MENQLTITIIVASPDEEELMKSIDKHWWSAWDAFNDNLQIMNYDKEGEVIK